MGPERARGAAMTMLPVVMAGGAGTRLWPLSRAARPKQFLPLVTERALLADMAAMAAGVAGAKPPVIVTGEAHRFAALAALDEAGVPHGLAILEPVGRSTAAVAAVAALAGAEAGPQTVIALLAADHAIADPDAFRAAIVRAAEAAGEGRIVTFGIVPRSPATGYGYIRPGEALGAGGLARVAAFVEKPDAEGAARLAREGALWNSGNFVFRADTMLHELGLHAPEVLEGARRAFAAAMRDGQFVRLDADAFGQCPAISLDYAVMEKTQAAAVLPLDLSWSDVGSWGALWDIGEKDAAGNVARGRVLLAGTVGSYVRAEKGVVAVLGLDGVIVVAEGDAVLVARRDKDQEVGRLVEALRAQGHGAADAHPRTDRPWGHYEGVHEGERHLVKHIALKPGAAISLQRHHHRAEHWVVVKGRARVTIGEEVRELGENESAYVPVGVVHRLENAGAGMLEIIEVQTGATLSEDDIERLEDQYGRV